MKNNLKIFITLLLVFGLLSPFFPLSNNKAEANPAEWLTGWDYRRAITIDNTSGGALTDYQVSVDTNSVLYNESGLVGSWHMNENSGTTISDNSGSSNNGTINDNEGDQWVTGKYGSGLDFDGTDDYVKCGDTDLPTGADSRTVEFWVKRSVFSNFTYYPYPFFYGTKTQYQGFGLYGNINTTDIWFYSHSYDFDTGINLDDTDWHHITIVYDGTNIRSYKDSVESSGSPTARPLLNTVLSDFDFTIGSFYVANQYWDGTIDEVRIYNRALSAEEVQAHFNASKVRLDYGDVRFTDSDGTTLLNYWMEKDGTFWTKIPSISASSQKTIYMYYGNAGATDGQTTTGTQSMPGFSCRTIKNQGSSTGDGIYYIDPNGGEVSDAFQVYCDMTYNGGGWTMLMKATRGTTFNYDSSYWTTTNTLNPTDLTRNDADAKYRSFNELVITDIMARWPDAGDIRWLKNSAWTARTALTGFNEYRNWGIPQQQSDWNSTYFSAQVTQCAEGPGRYGTKLKDIGGYNAGARWGYRFNENACGDWSSDDAGSGIGVWTDRNAAWRYSAGDWSNCCRESDGMLRSARVEVYGREFSSSSIPSVSTSIYAEQNNYTFTYRKAVTIDNTSNANTLYDYQVLVETDTATPIAAGHMNSDCSDIRFTDDSANWNDHSWDYSYSYWIESGCNSSSTKIWVKIPSIAASAEKTTYMYYGNASAGSQSSGDNTFEFFDDFEGTTIDTSKWTVTDGTGLSVSGGYLHGTNTTGRLTSKSTFSSGIIQEIKAKSTSLATNGQMIGGFYLSSSNSIGWLNHPGNAYYRNDGSWVNKGDETPANNMLYTIKVKSSSVVDLQMYSLDTSSIYWDVGDLSNTVSDEPIALGRRYDSDSYNGQAYTTDWDFLFVRKYTSVEPTTSVGGETVDNQSPTISSASDAPDPQAGGSSIVFSSTASDSDAGDTIKLYACKDSSCTNCGPSGTSNCWAYTETGVTTNPSASYSCPSCDYSINSYWAKVCDQNEACSSIISATEDNWLSGYDQRIKFTIDYTKVDSALTWFPVTVFLTSTQGEEVFTEFDADSDYLKVAFTTDDGTTELYAEMELFDVSEEKAIYHVSLDGWVIDYDADTDFYYYYDNDAADNTDYIGAINTAAGAAVWDANFKAVYHMVDATTSTILDSTSNSNDGTKSSANNPLQATGKVGFGQNFSTDKIDISSAASIDLEDYTSISISAIVNFTEDDTYYIWTTSYSGPSDFVELRIKGDDNKLYFRLYGVVGHTDLWIWESDDAISTGYHHVTVTHTNGSDCIMYVDGASVDFTATTEAGNKTHWTADRDSFIGGNYASSDYTSGIMDEVQVSGTGRTAAWIKATYNSLWDSLLTYGSEEEGGQVQTFSNKKENTCSCNTECPVDGVCDSCFGGYCCNELCQSTGCNVSPIISSVSDLPDPLQAGNDITFEVSWSDADVGDETKIHICKTDSITAQTCDGGFWCDTAVWSGSSPTSCDYTTQGGDIGSNNYYAFIVDDDNTASTSTAGSFEVLSNAPTISSVSDLPDPLQAGNDISFEISWSDADAGDETKIHICKTDSITTQTCDGGSWCDTAVWSGSSPTSCDYTTQGGDIGSNNYYAFVVDDHNIASISTAGNFEVITNEPPTISSVSDAPDPVPIGSSTLFRGYWSDVGDQTKIHVCKTDSITTQTCDGGSWCDATEWSTSSPSSCTYLVQAGDLGAQSYYAFICDSINNCSTSKAGSFNVTTLQEENSLILATTTASGFLVSSILDSGVSGGAGFHSLLWQGTLCSGCLVKFQLASSDSEVGPWNYYGPTSAVDYYAPNPGVSVTLPRNGDAAHQNRRYIRYKVYLEPYNSQSPQVDDIVINWSP